MKRKLILLTILQLFVLHISHASTESYVKLATKKELWKDKQWARLMHYKDGIFSPYEGQADGAGFYLSKNGKSNLRDELIATLKAQLNPTLRDDKNHPICRFPARFMWLNQKLGPFKGAPKVRCSDYHQFAQDLNAQSASLVFSSFHLDSPASAYGHTLLRLNKGAHPKTGKHHELLDFGINYAANATTDNVLLYAILGMVGGFKGTFSSVPYFYKIREYNDFESRDLWSYNLNMTKMEVQLLVAHIWEMGSTDYDYYYFTENCSYHMLTILEAVNPKWDLVDTLPLWIVPSETIKALYSVPGLVKSVSYRPSQRIKLAHSAAQLNSRELDAIFAIDSSRNFSKLDSLSKKESTKVLDVLMDYIDYRYAGEVLKEKGDAYLWKNEVLKKRSQYRERGINQKITPPLKDSPHLSHSQHRLSTTAGHNDDGSFQTASFRFSYHDLLDPKIGMPSLAQIEMLRFDLRYKYDEKKFVFDELALVDVESMNPWNSFSKKMSFHATLGAKSYNLKNCVECFAPSVEAGSGFTVRIGKDELLTTSIFIDGQLAYRPSFHRSGFYVAAGPKIRTIIWWNKKWVTKVAGHIYQSPSQKNEHFWKYGQETRYHIIKDLSVVLINEVNERGDEHRLGLHYYF